MSSEVLTVGKRKTAIARAVTKKGTGKVLINGVPIELYPIELLRNKMMEPLKILGDRASEIDIEIKVHGGGNTGQADACRTAISKGIVQYFSDDHELENTLRSYDRTMLVNDIRRKMPKKPMGYGARAKRQKSYR
ncbi:MULTISPECIES: 30S ribosomal protein S9 [Acidiplasma]|jgi:small subunit ribosomal protein S9|uniref:Small ribosomal subunit protein uS9 n=2 Tax=Acidiplasma TaxID=507753 RepID=A0A0Q1B7Y0_9ARCH|nr:MULTISPECIES: 30S ribosomal protein S9 [Acidiplasma]KJE49567.1 30S ribosomal protein S9 [Acidiplasma sp. MBA-1]KPV44971.1 30S ribosomal protein S9 [Acidiplasma aeolicum]KQB34059.1 30S ribosomal protein S9 [Acidiplasma aeolicum]KQB36319.1 30S ribosomal protein S9 [Acidiplasma cupricumulans]WMT54161.1 MAG: 30S ribosomal protein S9 [Acidiplasma sp.]